MVGFTGVTIILLGRTLLNGPAIAPASVIHQTAFAEPKIAKDQSSRALLDWLAQSKRLPQRNLFASKLESDVNEPLAPPTELTLETTIMQDPPRAMVNGRLVREGDLIDGFTVLKIQPRRIVVQREGPPIEIDMPIN